MMNSSSAQSKAPPPLPSPTSLFLHPTISHPPPPNAVGGGLMPSVALPVFLSIPVQSLSTNTSKPVMEATTSPLAPLTPVKGYHTQDRRFKEAIELIDPRQTQGNMLNFGTSQPPELVEHRNSFSRPDATTQWASKLQNDELLAVKPSEDDKRGAESINLNRTPRQKPKRKKHRPKVIQEGKPAKTPNPLTPKPVTPKPARSSKRTYVRKNRKQSGSDAPTGIIIEDVEPHDASSPNKDIDSQTNSNKSVRRSLNFDSEGHRESVLSNVVVPQLQEVFLQSTTCSGTKSTLQLSQGLEVVVDNTSAGIAFDLNQSLNQMLDDYIKLPEYPAGPTQLYRKERKRESLKDLARMKGSVNYHNEEEHAIPKGTSDVPLVEETLEDNGVWSYDDKVNIHGSYFPRIHKKRRTVKVCNEQAVDSPFASSNSKVFAFTHTQQLMALEGTTTDNTCAFDRIEIITKKRSKVPIRARNPSLLAASIACSSSTPENPCGCTDKQKSQSHGPHACMEALFADNCVKMMTKKRTKKRQVHLLSSIYSNIEQQQGIVSRNYKYFLGKEPIVECQCSNNLQGIIHSSLSSGPVLLHVNPLEEILQRLKNLSIDRSQEDITFHKEYAVIPYLGGGTMVPFEGAFDITKKRRPRAKVDLDPETCRVWKHLMVKGSLEADEELDMDKEKWWQDERGIFQGRVDSFIARMRLVQGDRRFSQWKGSVVDSVIGVFLTQNVSDHLSSSAFMALAARFPLQPRSKNGESSAETVGKSSEHNVECFPGFDDTIKGNEKNVHLEASKQGSMVEHDVQAIKGFNMADSKELHASYTESGNAGCLKNAGVGFYGRELEIGRETRNNSTNTLDLEMDNTNLLDRPLADVFSSQSSTVSSENSSDYATETIIQVGSSSDSNSEADLIVGKMCSGFNSPYMELPQIKETPKVLASCSNHSQRYFTEDNTGANERHASMNCDLSSEMSVGPAGVLNLKPAGADDSYASISCYSVQQLTSLQKEFSTRNNTLSRSNSMREVTETLLCSNILNSQAQGNLKDAPEVQTQTQQCTRDETCSSSCNSLRNEVAKADNSKLNDESYSSLNYPTETPSRAKKSKSKSESTKTVDWDTLRKQTCCYGAKKERSSERMDSLDWEAVRCADVNEVSKTIRERGMNNVLAGRIKDFLDRLVRDHGSIDLEWLRHVPPDKAKDYLLSIRGLGLKSVECVRLLTLHHLAFPVDTNVGRICVRLGWVPLRPLPESLQLHLLELYPVLETIQKYLWPRLCTLDQRTLYELHYHMITFGKVFCTKSKPNCNACPMRGECKHFASAFASARLALPGPEETSLVTSSFPDTSKNGHNVFFNSVHLPQLDGVQQSQEKIVSHSVSVFKSMALPQLEGSELSKQGTPIATCEPIIEEPTTPPPESAETVEREIEDAFYEDPDEIPTIELNLREFTQNLEKYVKENNVEVQEGDWSKALVTLSPEAASIPMPKLKNVSRLRTEHQVYELPDSHPLLEERDQREPDDPCPYLLAIWTPGETAQSTELPETCCDTRDTGKLCDKRGCFTCNSIREAHAQTVRGTLLIPCRTAMRGSFPLNGTYFQVNEVFADHDSSNNPIYVPRRWIWNLPRRTVFFGTSIPTIFRGLTTEGIQHCFWRGFVCVRGFERKTRAPRPLSPRLHLPASRAPSKTKRAAEEELVAPMKKRERRARKRDDTQL